MLFIKGESFAQFADRFLKIAAFALVLMSVSYGVAAVSHFVEEPMQETLEAVRALFGLGAAALVLLPFLRLMYLRFKSKGDCEAEPEGFLADIYAKSTINAFAAGFILLIFLEPMATKVLHDVPPAFFVQSALSVMMAVLGLNFFFKSLASDDELDDEFDDGFDAEAGPKE